MGEVQGSAWGRDASPEDAYCELSFSPNVSLIATVRRFVGEFYARVLEDPEVTSRLVVATHELLENAVRYSADGQSSIRIGVQRRDRHVEIGIETRNRTTPDRYVTVRGLLDEMNGAKDRGAFYQALLRRSARRETGSGLGLGRIYAESEMDLSVCLTGDVLHLRARASFASKMVTA